MPLTVPFPHHFSIIFTKHNEHVGVRVHMELNCTIQGGSDTDVHVPQSLRGGDSSVVRALDLWLKGCGFESLQEWKENFLLWGQLSLLTLILVSVPPPYITAVARKDPCHSTKSAGAHGRSQLNMHTPYVCGFAWSVKWHGAWLYGVHRTCTEMAAVSCGTSHASAVSIPP